MNRIVFKNIAPKSWIRNLALERIEGLGEKYPEFSSYECLVTLECRNSPFQAGADEYAVTLHVTGPGHKRIHLTKSSDNLLKSLATAIDRMDELVGKSRLLKRRVA